MPRSSMGSPHCSQRGGVAVADDGFSEPSRPCRSPVVSWDFPCVAREAPDNAYPGAWPVGVRFLTLFPTTGPPAVTRWGAFFCAPASAPAPVYGCRQGGARGARETLISRVRCEPGVMEPDASVALRAGR